MRTQLIFGALFAVACISDPAYIGEGPAGGSGASDTSGGTGPTGTGGAIGGTGGTAATLAPSGVPIPPPTESGSCTVTKSSVLSPERRALITWDAETRTLAEEYVNTRFDGRGLPVERWTDSGWRSRFAYDTHGTVISLDSELYGNHDPNGSYVRRNDYDSEGRLIRSQLVSDSGRVETFHLNYSDDQMTLLERTFDSEATPRTIYYVNEYEGGRPVRHEIWQYGVLTDIFTASYDGAGRLVQAEWDAGIGVTGADGIAEFRDQWFYDDKGRIVRAEGEYVQEIESGAEYDSSIDGVPEEIWLLEPACADIAVDPYSLYGMPHWLFPYWKNGWF